jgi:hypothetical protein
MVLEAPCASTLLDLIYLAQLATQVFVPTNTKRLWKLIMDIFGS